MAKLTLFGPDKKYGDDTRVKARVTKYIWHITWRENGQDRSRSTGFEFGQRAEADIALGRWLEARRDIRPAGPRDPAEILIADVLSLYIADRGADVADPGRIGYATQALLGWWDDRAASAITGPTCRAYLKHREKQGCKSTTVRRELGHLSTALAHALTEGYLISRPAVWLPPRPQGGGRTWYTRQTIAALVRAARRQPKARDHLPLLILMGVYIGVRSKSALQRIELIPSTCNPWVDFKRRRIVWPPSLTKKQYPAGETPVPPRLYRFFSAASARGQRFAVEYRGRQVTSLKRAWANACGAAGLAVKVPMKDAAGRVMCRKDGSPRMRWQPTACVHELRHTAATWLMQLRVPLWEAAGALGMSVDTLQKHYGHHHPDHMDSFARAHDVGRRAGSVHD